MEVLGTDWIFGLADCRRPVAAAVWSQYGRITLSLLPIWDRIPAIYVL